MSPKLIAFVLYPLQNLVERFSLFEGWGVGGVTERNYRYGIDISLEPENLIYHLRAEVADPARAKTYLGRSQADVLGGDGCVDVGVVVTITLAGPRLRLISTHYDIEWGLLKPLLRIASVQGSALLFALDDDKSPRLEIHC